MVQPIRYNEDIGNDKISDAFAQGPQGGNYTYGILASIQNNENGDPFWIVSGNWRTNLLDISNQFNGTGEHTHTITNFVLEDITMPDNMTTIFHGDSTPNFREGPIADIPTTITFTNDKVISIWLDPAKISYHYGNTPIYGVAVNEMH